MPTFYVIFFVHGKPGQTRGPVRLVVLSRDDVDGILNEILNKCDVTKVGDTPEVPVTGVGSAFHKAKFEEGLGIR